MRRYVSLVYLVYPAIWLWKVHPLPIDTEVLDLAVGLALVIGVARLPELVKAVGEAVAGMYAESTYRLEVAPCFAGVPQPIAETPDKRQKDEPERADDPPPDEPAHPPAPHSGKESRPESPAPPREKPLSPEEEDRKAAQTLMRAVDRWQSVEDRGQLPLLR